MGVGIGMMIGEGEIADVVEKPWRRCDVVGV
jgi:hypothetical protein